MFTLVRMGSGQACVQWHRVLAKSVRPRILFDVCMYYVVAGRSRAPCCYNQTVHEICWMKPMPCRPGALASFGPLFIDNVPRRKTKFSQSGWTFLSACAVFSACWSWSLLLFQGDPAPLWLLICAMHLTTNMWPARASLAIQCNTAYNIYLLIFVKSRDQCEFNKNQRQLCWMWWWPVLCVVLCCAQYLWPYLKCACRSHGDFYVFQGISRHFIMHVFVRLSPVRRSHCRDGRRCTCGIRCIRRCTRMRQ